MKPIARFAILLCWAVSGFVVICRAQTVPQSPSFKSSSILSIESLAHEKRWQEVSDLAQKVTLTDPESPSAFYWLGMARLQMHDSVGAVQVLRAAQTRGLDTALLHEDLGLAYYDLNQFLLFEREMQKVIQLDPQDFRPSYYLGLYHLTIRSDPNGALPFFDQATKLKPDDWKSLYEQGNCLEKLGKPDEARQYYLRSISSVESGSQPFGWPFQGMARLLLESDPDQALSFATKAVKAEPNEYSNHLVLAKVLQRLGNRPEALREAREAIQENPTDAPSAYLLFLLYKQSGESSLAAAELKTFQTLNAVYGPE